MLTLKNYLNYFRLRSSIEDVIAIKENHFVKDQYFKSIIAVINSIEKIKNSDLIKTFEEFFHKNKLNQKQTLKLLFITHEILRDTDSYEVTECIIEALFYLCGQLSKIQDQKLKEINSYLKRSFTLPYATYLIKAYKKDGKEEFKWSKQRKNGQLSESKQSKQKSISTNQNHIEMDFTIFNLVTDILKFNSDLHQMGRFYSDHQYAINIYLQMLRDFEIYFIIIQQEFNRLSRLSKDLIIEEEAQKIYLYMSESERCVNKMNSFYYNKYLFYYVNDKIHLKMHLEIPQQFYPVLNRSHRRIQKKLSFDICLTAHQPDTRDTNRSKPYNFSKIAQSIVSLNQTLEQIENLQKIQSEKRNNDIMKKSSLF